MPDPGFVSAFVGVGIAQVIEKILHRINIAVRCKKELESLKDLVVKIQPIVEQIQKYRQAINMKKKDKVSPVSGWLKDLEALLQEASEMTQRCTIPRGNVALRYQTSMKISGLISHINKHLNLSPLVGLAQIPELLEEQNQKLEQIKERLETLPSSTCSASTCHGAFAPTGCAEMKLIDEPFIVGQQKAFPILESLVIAEAEAKNIGVLGKGGSGKTLILKTLFNCEKVRNHFRDGLLLWLTVSQSPSFKNLRNELRTQIALQTGLDLGKNLDEEGVKLWLNDSLQKSRNFIFFLDDVWGEHAAELLEELGVQRPVRDHSKSKVIVSARDRTALLKMGVADIYTVRMEDLGSEESWKLFACHAFPYNNGNAPANIDEDIAKRVCCKCGGLPLAIKVVGRAMSASTLAKQWRSALQSLPKANSVYDCLRLSYDALGNEDVNIQLCFLYIASACLESEILYTESVFLFWVGEGLLARKMLQYENQLSYDPFEMGRIYVNVLADRCLIEPIIRDFEGHVVMFRIHNVLQDLAIRVAEEEEGVYRRVGRYLTALNENDFSERTRIFLSLNKLSSFPMSLRAPQIRSLVMKVNKDLTNIPKSVIGSMISLKVLDLSWTSLKSLPDSVGFLKQLVYLDLAYTPIKKLPASFTNLVNLEILCLSGSSITELPYGLHKLASLKCLDLWNCKDLQYLPCSISKLISLQYLYMEGCESLWAKPGGNRGQNVAFIDDLTSLKQLKMLQLQNNGKIISEGTLGSMVEMDTLSLTLGEMENLPDGLSSMSKLRRLSLECSDLVKLGSSCCDLQNLSYFRLFRCLMLEDLSDLYMLSGLRRLEIISCFMLKKLPKEFGGRGVFPLLEIFSLVSLFKLEELPVLEEGAMPSLQIFTIVDCPHLKILPKYYLNLKTLQKIRIYNDCGVIENSQHMKAKVVTMSSQDTEKALKAVVDSMQLDLVGGYSMYGTEMWGSEFFLFYHSLFIGFYL